MATKDITIRVTKSPDFKSIVLQDITEWSGDSRESLADIVLNFYTTDITSIYKTYTLTQEEEDEFVNTGSIILSFLTMFSEEYFPDNWYYLKVSTNADDTDQYESNIDGFAIYARIKAAAYINNLNGLHTPDKYRGSIEPIALQIMWLDGLDWLDTDIVNNRAIKSLKRMRALIKLNK